MIVKGKFLSTSLPWGLPGPRAAGGAAPHAKTLVLQRLVLADLRSGLAVRCRALCLAVLQLCKG